jgi:hypothetical protein
MQVFFYFTSNESYFPLVERSFHESINAELLKNVEPVTDWTDLPCFGRAQNVTTSFTSDSMVIEEWTADLLNEILTCVQGSPPELYLIALAIKTEQRPGEAPKLHMIQLRTPNKILVLKV